MIFKNDEYILTSGRVMYANLGLISVKKYDNGDWRLFDGYDGGIYLTEWDDNSNEVPKYTKEDLIEIANHQRQLWTDFMLDVMKEKVPTK